jgi:dolichol kinase
MAFGLFFASLHHSIPKSVFLKFTVVLSTFTLAFELLRYQKGFQWMNDIIFKILGDGIRKHEMEGKFTGSFYYFVGVTFTSMLYSKPCATLGIIQLALADPAASYFGTKTKHVYWSRIEK